jgi:formylmethanofuran dehydrogenase subunit B
VIAVDVGRDGRGPADADLRVAIAAEEEAGTLAALLAVLRESAPAEDAMWERARTIVTPLLAARYVALVSDGEPAAGRDPERIGLLITLGQALNGPTRAAHVVLRAGGNRNGADAVTTWQTGYPLAVDFARGYPRYRPIGGTAAERLARGEVDVALVVGSLDGGRVPDALVAALGGARCVVIGPRASESPLDVAVAIDGAVVGIHEAGVALRMDDVPLPMRALLDGPPATTALVRALGERVRWGLRGVERAGSSRVGAR